MTSLSALAAIETIRSDPDYNGGNYTSQPRMMKYAVAAYGFASAGGTLSYQALTPAAENADKMVKAGLIMVWPLPDGDDNLRVL